MASKDELHTVGDFARLFEDDPLAFEPGERFGCGNNGPVVLGEASRSATLTEFTVYYVKDG